ncbi:MAG TPA: J domain-containing protein [Ramlibacter sp.]|nr:J domain-containing protein [Ramlibacter sp.]
MTKFHCHSHYETLRVDRGASPERVRTAYRRLAQKFHPDKHAGKSAAATVMAAINQAYEVLSDPAQRVAYDDWLTAQEAQGAGPGAAAVFIPDRFGWAAWLLWATASIAVLTVGFVMIKTMMPLHGPAPRPALAAPPAPALAIEPPVPARPVQPWTEPAKSALPRNPETDPVARLVREGTLEKPSRANAGAP